MSDFVIHHNSFKDIIGGTPSLQLLGTKDYAFAHEAGVYFASRKELFITSNRLNDERGEPYVEITKVTVGEDAESTTMELIPSTRAEQMSHSSDIIYMANGAVRWTDDKILVCAQGHTDQPSGLVAMSTTPPYAREFVVSDFYGRPFNSVNDVVVHSDGSIWFTDPSYGYEQGYRPSPALPDQVYRFDPADRSIRVVADGFVHPNGLCFSPDEKILYVTDTGRVHGSLAIDDRKPSTIYAYDVVHHSGSHFLTGRRVFAFAANGIPDGIKCDTRGNVYSGCGDGVNVWSPGGVLLGNIKVDGGVANFCFGVPGELYLLNETKLWRARISSVTSACSR